MEPIRVSVHFTERDYIRLNYLMSYRNPILIAITAFGLFNTIYLICTFRNETAPLNNEFGFLVSVMTLGYLPVRLFFRGRKVYRKAAKAIDVTYTFDSEGFKVTGKDLDLSQTWKQVHSVREIGSWYMIYIGPKQAHYLPKKSFAANEQETRFRELLRGTGRPLKLKNAT